MRVALPILLVVAFSVYAAVDCLLSPRTLVPRRWWWLLGILVVPVLGPALWFAVGRPRRRPPAPPPGAVRGPLAPDDDPDFLRRLDPPEGVDWA